jgi:precorrin-6B methylase 2
MSRSARRELVLVFTLGIVVTSAVGRVQGQSASMRQQESAREAWQKVGEILAAMRIGSGSVVADVGAGDGFLTARLARAVGPAGQVFAVDADDRAIERLRARVEQEALTNVTVVKGDAHDPHLDATSLDAVVIVNSYHEMVDHQAMLQRLRAALKPGGRLVIVEPIADKLLLDARERQTNVHEIAARFVEQEAREAGFRIETLHDPFVRRSGGSGSDVVEWLIVAVPMAHMATVETRPALAADETPAADPDLRIAFDAFKKRRAEGSIVVIDVRSEEEFLEGHIPGATWVQLSDLSSQVERLRALRKPVVTYCS